jgi:catechol 2,3-dioxygenase-like lactoylglutathione lyase family enzyme
MRAKLNYAIKFVKNMDQAVAFHRETLGLPLKFQSPEWSEFATGDVTLALHLASEKNPAGRVELGYAVKGLEDIYANREKLGLAFSSAPKPLHGVLLANFIDSEGQSCSISEAPAAG